MATVHGGTAESKNTPPEEEPSSKVAPVLSDALRKEAEDKFQQSQKDDDFRLRLRNLNTEQSRLDGGSAREKSILKVQKFVNRLKRFGDADKDSTLAELSKLDISMHISEVCDGLCDGEIKLKDVPALMEVCSLAYRQYSSEFSSGICASAFRSFRDSADVTVPANALRRKWLPRLLIELVLIGVCQDSEALPKVVNDLCDTSRCPSDPLAVHNVSVIETLCKKFDTAILGSLVGGTKMELVNGMSDGGHNHEKKCCLSKVTQSALRGKLSHFYRSSASAVLQQAHAAVEQQTKLNQQRKIAKGNIDAESETKYQVALSTFNRLRMQLQYIGDMLSQPIPTLESEAEEGITRVQADVNDKSGAVSKSLDSTTGPESLWENDTERDFYENILNLSDAVPGSLLGLGLKPQPEAVGTDVIEEEGEAEDQKTGTVPENVVVPRVSVDESVVPDITVSASLIPGTTTKHTLAEKKNLLLDQFFEKLCQATLGAEVDGLAMNFFYDQLNVGKSNRRRLSKLLLTSHRNDLFVLPVLARFVATVAPYCKDLSQTVVEGAMSDYRDSAAIKDATKLESKIKTARYLGELCKFQLLPTGTLLEIIQDLLEDFSYLNVEVVCHIIQSCGKYLLFYKGLGERFQSNVLTKLMRIKTVRNLPVYLEVMVEDTYFQLRPSEKKRRTEKEIPIVRQYINHLIGVESQKGREVQVVRSIRALNWEDKSVIKWLKKAIHNTTRSSSVTFPGLASIASLLCALAPGHPEFVIDTVDDLFESIQVGLERNDFREMPYRFREIKLLGELFNYRLLDSSGILDILYHLIGFGGPTCFGCSHPQTFRRLAVITNNSHLLCGGSTQESSDALVVSVGVSTSTHFTPLIEPTAPEDLPGDYFRLRLACLLLHTSGQYFTKGSAKDKMERFLTFFQRYILCKAPTPMNIQYVFADAVQELRPRWKIFNSIRDVDAAIVEITAKDEQLQLPELKDNDEDDERPIDLIPSEHGASENELMPEESIRTSGSEDECFSEKDDEDVFEDEDEKAQKSMEVMEAEMFELALSNMITESLREAKTSISGPRGRDEIKLPNLSKFTGIDATVTDDVPEDHLRVKLITRKGKDKVNVKALDIPRECRLSMALYDKKSEDAEEHAKLKKFVLDSVVRSRKQDVSDREMQFNRLPTLPLKLQPPNFDATQFAPILFALPQLELRRQLFSAGSRRSTATPTRAGHSTYKVSSANVHDKMPFVLA